MIGKFRLASVLSLCMSALLFSQDEELDLDAMWENTVWNEIEDVVDEGYEVEKITAVAGVRGAEAEDEALQHLYYRRSMKGLTKLELQRALGKLINKRDALDKNHLDIPKLNRYIKQRLIEIGQTAIQKSA